MNARVTDTSSLTARIARSSTMTNREGQTVLFFAAQSGRAAVVRFLLDHGASVNAMGDSGEALLNAARNNAEVTNMLRTAMSKGIARSHVSLTRVSIDNASDFTDFPHDCNVRELSAFNFVIRVAGCHPSSAALRLYR